MKKTLSLVLTLVLALALCAPAYAAVTPKGTFPIVDAPLTLKVAMPVNSKVEDIHTNQLTLWIEEQTGIDLEIIELSPSDTATQVNMIMNSGDLPDIFLGYNFPYDVLCSYADAGLLSPLDDYIEQYGDNVFNVQIADPAIGERAWGYVSYDDHIWAMPNGGALITDQFGGFYNRIQVQFLEALGMEMPHTLDELYNFLVAVRDQDVNGNGDPNDEIPMSTFAKNNYIFRTISQAWQYTDPSNYLKVNDGKVSFIANNEYFLEALTFVKKLVDEGLADPASFTQDESVMAAILAQEGNQIGIYACGNMYTNSMDSTGDEYQNMRLLPNLTGPYGYKSSMVGNSVVRRTMVVTSACKNVDAAVRLFDFLLSDESALAVRVGFEGEQWKVADQGILGRDGQQAWFSLLTTQEWVQPSTNVIWDEQSFIHSNIMNHCEAAQTAVKYTTPADIIEWKLVEENTFEAMPQLLMTPDDEAEYNELKTLIVDYVDTNIAQFVLGDRSLDEFDDYCKDLLDMGLERYIELAQGSVDAVSK